MLDIPKSEHRIRVGIRATNCLVVGYDREAKLVSLQSEFFEGTIPAKITDVPALNNFVVGELADISFVVVGIQHNLLIDVTKISAAKDPKAKPTCRCDIW